MIYRNVLAQKLEKLSEKKEMNVDEAFMHHINELFDDEATEENIVDGSQDKQIDIIQIEQIEELSIIRIFQVKNEKGFKSNEIIKIRNGVDWIFNKEIQDVEKLKNPSFICRIKEIRELLTDTPYSNVIVEIYYVTQGNLKDIRQDDEIYQEIKTFQEIYKNIFGHFAINLLGSKEILEAENTKLNKLRSIDTMIKIQYDVNNPSLIRNYSPNINSAICFVRAAELVKLIDENYDDIFEMNVRKYLNVKGKVNSKIYESCIDDKEAKIFSVLNNGITIICDEFSVNPIPNEANINMKNMQIINGCQTSMTLYSAFKNQKLKDSTMLLLRIHETRDKDLIDKIIIATNNQNPINPRDLKANTDEQIFLQAGFKERFALNYQRKRNDSTDIYGNVIRKNELISNEKVGQATLAIGLKKPYKALGSKSIVFTTEYKHIFALDKINIKDYVLYYLIYSRVEMLKKEACKNLNKQFQVEVVKYGAYHISYITYALLCRKKIDLTEVGVCEFKDNPGKLDNVIQEAMEIAFISIPEEVKVKGTVINYLKTKQSQDNIMKQLGK